jgi:dihydrofolate reductase
MKISIISAMSENRVIGKGNQLPWDLPEDLKRFQKITSGHPVIMGRKTYDSMGKPLPKRTNLVITRNRSFHPEGVNVFESLPMALEFCKKNQFGEIFIIGGGEIFKQAIPYTEKFYLTILHRHVEGDTFFPDIDFKPYTLVEKIDHPGYSYITYERK